MLDVICDTNYFYYLVGIDSLHSDYDADKILNVLSANNVICPNTALMEIVVHNYLKYENGYEYVKKILLDLFQRNLNFVSLNEIGYIEKLPSIDYFRSMLMMDKDQFMLAVNTILTKKVEIEVTFIMLYIQYIIALYVYVHDGKEKSICEVRKWIKNKDELKRHYKEALAKTYLNKGNVSDIINNDLYKIFYDFNYEEKSELSIYLKQKTSVTNIFKKIDKKFGKIIKFTEEILANDSSCFFNELGGKYFILIFLQLVQNGKKIQEK